MQSGKIFHFSGSMLVLVRLWNSELAKYCCNFSGSGKSMTIWSISTRVNLLWNFESKIFIVHYNIWRTIWAQIAYVGDGRVWDDTGTPVFTIFTASSIYLWVQFASNGENIDALLHYSMNMSMDSIGYKSCIWPTGHGPWIIVECRPCQKRKRSVVLALGGPAE